MFVPSMMNMADAMADSCYTEEQVFDLGLSQAIVFLVVVPLVGACRVPNDALSHFMAGADEYNADAMPEHYSGALSGPWTIKRERLRILPASWAKWVADVEAIEALSDLQDQSTAPNPAPVDPESASDGAELNNAGIGWSLKAIERVPGYRWPLYQVLKAAYIAGQPCPKARDVLHTWETKPHPDVQVMPGGLKYNDGLGKPKEADLKAIQQAIKNLVKLPAGQAPPNRRTD
jgi:hypothetical protein